MTATGYQVPRCECGHAEGDHQSNGSSWPHPLRFGVCHVAGCACRAFSVAAKHDADCRRRGDWKSTSLCTCGLTDAEVERATQRRAA